MKIWFQFWKCPSVTPVARCKRTHSYVCHSGLNTAGWWMLRCPLRIRLCYCLFINFARSTRFFLATVTNLYLSMCGDAIGSIRHDLWNAPLIDFDDSELCPSGYVRFTVIAELCHSTALCLLLKWQELLGSMRKWDGGEYGTPILGYLSVNIAK